MQATSIGGTAICRFPPESGTASPRRSLADRKLLAETVCSIRACVGLKKNHAARSWRTRSRLTKPLSASKLTPACDNNLTRKAALPALFSGVKPAPMSVPISRARPFPKMLEVATVSLSNVSRGVLVVGSRYYATSVRREIAAACA